MPAEFSITIIGRAGFLFPDEPGSPAETALDIPNIGVIGVLASGDGSLTIEGGELAVHHERAARSLERLAGLYYDVVKPKKECLR